MKLYSAPLSLFSRKVEIALRKKAIDFEREMARSPRRRATSRGIQWCWPSTRNGRSPS